MRNRFGAILCLLLGSVLIWSGLSATTSASVGTTAYLCQTPPVAALVTQTPCPTGTINFAEVSDLSGAPGTTPPSTWTVRVTSPNCVSPSGTAVNEVVVVNNNGNNSTGNLFVYGDSQHSVVCQYVYAEDAVAGYTTNYDPTSPQTIPDAGGASNSRLNVTVTNTADAVATESISPSPTATPTKTATSSKPPTHSASSSKAPTAVTSAASSSTPPALATTGPRSSVGTSVLIGIGLCALGLVMLLAGRRPKPARHRNR